MEVSEIFDDAAVDVAQRPISQKQTNKVGDLFGSYELLLMILMINKNIDIQYKG